MRSMRLLALTAAMAVVVTPLAMGTAQADNDNSKRPDGAGPPAQSQVQSENHHRKSIGITKLAFAGPEADEVTKVRELDVTAGDVTVKVIVQFKTKDAVKPAAAATAQWTMDDVAQSDIPLTRKGKAKRVSNWHGSLVVPTTAVNGTVYCLTGADVDEVAGAPNLNKGQAKRSCFTVVSATLPQLTP